MADDHYRENDRGEKDRSHEQPAMIVARLFAGFAHDVSEEPANEVLRFAVLFLHEAKETQNAVNNAENRKRHKGRDKSDSHKAPPSAIIYHEFPADKEKPMMRCLLERAGVYSALACFLGQSQYQGDS
jgi:hypothetical protein